jgi:hypothetical protein
MNSTDAVKSVKPVYSIALVLCLGLLGTSCATSDEDSIGELAALGRECRTTKTMGSKMRQSVCLSTAEWAAIDIENAERIVREEQTAAFLRRMEDYRAMNPIKPGDRYNPYPSQ